MRRNCKFAVFSFKDYLDMSKGIEATEHQETGWERVRALFDRRTSGEFADEIQHIPTVVCASSVFGFIFGGRFGARIAAEFYSRHNKVTVYKSAMHAQREYQSAQTVGFVKYGCRWGWRMGLFAGLYSSFLVVFATYRNKDDALNYVASGLTTGAVYKMTSGWRGMLVAMIICGGVSLPVGLLAQAGNTFLIPEEYKQQEIEEKAMREQRRKMQLRSTENLIQDMEKELESNLSDGSLR